MLGQDEDEARDFAPKYPVGGLLTPSWHEIESAAEGIVIGDRADLEGCYLDIRRQFTDERMTDEWAPEVMLGLCIYAWYELLPYHGRPVSLAQLAEQCSAGDWAKKARIYVIRREAPFGVVRLRIVPASDAGGRWDLEIEGRTLTSTVAIG
jgi:hypothetical protein